ncbi:MAG: diguanylate cyclase [Roseburia sp.]|nr:diguanylate cyclase [Roseburia sp.]
MSALTYLQVHLVPVIALFMVWINMGKTPSFSWRNRVLRQTMILLAMVMVINMAAWMLDGQMFPGVRLILHVLNTLYFLLSEVVALLWLFYVYGVVENKEKAGKKFTVLALIPQVCMLVVLAGNPWTKLVYELGGQNDYERGRCYLLHTAVTAGYLLAASAMALHHCRREKSGEKRRQYRWLAGFIILPLCGAVFQILFYGLELILPLTTASLLLIHIYGQQNQVTRDALTGLNNRRRLNQYLNELETQSWGEGACYFVLLDVDKFKMINDTYGHVEGDVVLRQVADQMKKVFGDSRSFLARYGGDEFVIVLRDETEEQLEARITKLKDGVAMMSWADGRPWEISLSVGYASWEEIADTKTLVETADGRMYEEKNKKKNR